MTTKSDRASEVKTHELFSASASERWLNCAGSIALSQSPNCPPSFETSYASEGTDGHYTLEQLIIHRKKPLATADFLKKKYGTEMVEWSLWALREIEKRVPKGAELRSERKIKLAHIDKDMGGTPDVAIIEYFKRLTIIDYKYGVGVVVDPEENTQLILYALGVAHEFDYNFEEVALVVMQPRAEHSKGPIREWVISMDKLMEWEKVFRKGAKAGRDPNAPRVPGTWCRWCPARVICPEISSLALKQAQIDFAPDSGKLDLPAPNETGITSLDQLGKTLVLMERVELWIAELKAYAFHQLSKGKEVPGWKLVEKRSTRKWNDVPKVEIEAVKMFGKKALTEPELLSPAQMEKVAGKDWVNARASSISSGLTLVDAGDKRPATNQAALDFAPKKGEENETVLKMSSKDDKNDKADKQKKGK